MSGPPDPRDRTDFEQPTWRSILAGYAPLAGVLLSLWIVSNPIAGAVGLTAAAGLFLGARRAAELARCFRVCREFTVDLGGSLRITVTNARVDDAS